MGCLCCVHLLRYSNSRQGCHVKSMPLLISLPAFDNILCVWAYREIDRILQLPVVERPQRFSPWPARSRRRDGVESYNESLAENRTIRQQQKTDHSYHDTSVAYSSAQPQSDLDLGVAREVSQKHLESLESDLP